MTSIFSPQSDTSRSSLEMHVPASVYPLEHPETQKGIALLQQLINLAFAVGDGLHHVQSAFYDTNCCLCALSRLQGPVQRYSQGLAERYELNVGPSSPTNLNEADAFTSLKARLNRELKRHVTCIEKALKYYGEKIDVARIFSDDAKLLIRIGTEVDHLLQLVIEAGDAKEAKVCEKCGKETNSLTSATLSSRRARSADTGPAGQLAAMANTRLQPPRASVGGLRLARSSTLTDFPKRLSPIPERRSRP